MNYWHHERYKPKPFKGQEVKWYEPKFDGFRVTAFKDAAGDVVWLGRDPTIPLVLDNWRWFFDVRDLMPPHSSLDGEVHFPGKPATWVAHAIASKVEELYFNPFAMPVVGGHDMTYADIAVIHPIIKSLNLTPPVRRPYNGETADVLRKQAMSHGIEGYILKNHHYDEWYKVKRVETVDCIVHALKPGNGKYRGVVGALILKLADGTMIGNCSGMSDAERYDITKNDIGRVCEVAFQEWGVNGKLVQPRFIRWRDDKPAAECTRNTVS